MAIGLKSNIDSGTRSTIQPDIWPVFPCLPITQKTIQYVQMLDGEDLAKVYAFLCHLARKNTQFYNGLFTPCITKDPR